MRPTPIGGGADDARTSGLCAGPVAARDAGSRPEARRHLRDPAPREPALRLDPRGGDDFHRHAVHGACSTISSCSTPTSRQDRLDRIVPELATAWKWSEDGRTLTFTLRDGVKWHDGQPFTSADVKCTWDTLIGQREAGCARTRASHGTSTSPDITTNGDREVSFHLNEPQPSLLAMLAGGFSPVYPCHVTFAQMRTHPIGTGPFKFADWKQNNSIKLVQNPDYWKPGRPYLDEIDYTIIPNRATAMLAFIAGQVGHDVLRPRSRPPC